MIFVEELFIPSAMELTQLLNYVGLFWLSCQCLPKLFHERLLDLEYFSFNVVNRRILLPKEPSFSRVQHYLYEQASLLRPRVGYIINKKDTFSDKIKLSITIGQSINFSTWTHIAYLLIRVLIFNPVDSCVISCSTIDI